MTTRLCIDCRWCKKRPDDDPIVASVPEDYPEPLCANPDCASPVDGKPYRLCITERHDYAGCGPHASNWDHIPIQKVFPREL